VTTKNTDLERMQTVVIENVEPCLDGGRYPIKRVVGQALNVSADIFKDGHDQIAATLKWRRVANADWNRTPMSPTENDRWEGVCHFIENAPHEYTMRRGKITSNHGRSNMPRNMPLVGRTFELRLKRVQSWSNGLRNEQRASRIRSGWPSLLSS